MWAQTAGGRPGGAHQWSRHFWTHTRPGGHVHTGQQRVALRRACPAHQTQRSAHRHANGRKCAEVKLTPPPPRLSLYSRSWPCSDPAAAASRPHPHQSIPRRRAARAGDDIRRIDATGGERNPVRNSVLPLWGIWVKKTRIWCRSTFKFPMTSVIFLQYGVEKYFSDSCLSLAKQSTFGNRRHLKSIKVVESFCSAYFVVGLSPPQAKKTRN